MNMNEYDCQTIKNIIFQLSNSDSLKGKIFIAGGIVPYLYSSLDSGRKHVDIDIVVEQTDMPSVRQYLIDQQYYSKAFDSLEFDYNQEYIDYGLEVFIDGVPVNFAPFIVHGVNIVQRNFMKKELSGHDALATVKISNISLNDYVTVLEQSDGTHIGTYTIEMVKCAKESSNREKDIYDIKEIERVGFSEDRYNRVKPAVQNMQITWITPDNVRQ